MYRVVLALVLLMLMGCGSVEHIHTHTTDTIYRESVRVDSIFHRDSVLLHVFTQGDTVYSVREVVRWRDRVSVVRDTAYVSRVDTIRVPCPVERKLSLLESVKRDFGEVVRLVAVVACTAFVLWFVGLLRRRK